MFSNSTIDLNQTNKSPWINLKKKYNPLMIDWLSKRVFEDFFVLYIDWFSKGVFVDFLFVYWLIQWGSALWFSICIWIDLVKECLMIFYLYIDWFSEAVLNDFLFVYGLIQWGSAWWFSICIMIDSVRECLMIFFIVYWLIQ